MTIRIVCMSDHHHRYRKLKVPPGDILIHAGDFTRRGTLEELAEFNAFLATLPHRHKIVIAGNHDFCCQEEPGASRTGLSQAIYLQDQAVEREGIRFYGSPWQPRFCNLAFNLDRGAALKAKWDLIPPETDVLITHGPPLGFGDQTLVGTRVGCTDLLAAVERVRPRLHVFGHIHEGAGVYQAEGITYINASVCSLAYRVSRKPVVFDYRL